MHDAKNILDIVSVAEVFTVAAVLWLNIISGANTQF